jgi:hypothetical protein
MSHDPLKITGLIVAARNQFSVPEYKKEIRKKGNRK